MKTGVEGLALIKHYEGLRLTAYQDSVGIWTIGYGSTAGIIKGMVITEAKAEAFLQQDLETSEQAVSKLVTVPLDQNEFDALVSFVFNLGQGALAKSTLLKKLNALDRSGAASEFLKWNRAGNKPLRGLTIRRESERRLFLS